MWQVFCPHNEGSQLIHLIAFTPTGIGTLSRIKEIALVNRPFLGSVCCFCANQSEPFSGDAEQQLWDAFKLEQNTLWQTPNQEHNLSPGHIRTHMQFFFHILNIATIILCINFWLYLTIMTNFRDMLWKWNSATCCLGYRTSFQRRCDYAFM